MRVENFTIKDWTEVLAKNAHQAVFQEDFNPLNSKADFALMVIDDNNKPICYTTIREIGFGGAYMEFGGSFPDYRGTIKVSKAWMKFIGWLSEKYSFLSFATRNNNKPMIKLGLLAGFTITGAYVDASNAYLLQHTLNFNKEKK